MDLQQTIVIVLLVLNGSVLLLARRFDRRVYIPFLLKTKGRNTAPQLYNLHLLRLGVCVACAGAAVYAVIGWLLWH